MKIIQRGHLPENVPVRLTCRRCHTLFEFEVREATYTSDQREGDYYHIACPLCSRQCFVSALSVRTRQNIQQEEHL